MNWPYVHPIGEAWVDCPGNRVAINEIEKNKDAEWPRPLFNDIGGHAEKYFNYTTRFSKPEDKKKIEGVRNNTLKFVETICNKYGGYETHNYV